MAAERGQRGGQRGGTRGRGGAPVKKKDDGSILGAVATPFEWLVNQVSRPAYYVGALAAGDPVAAAKEVAAFTTLGLSEKLPGMDAPEITVSKALQQRGVDFGSGVPGFLLRFGTDIITDPASYVSFGTSSVVKGAVREAARRAGQEAVEEAAKLGLRGAEKNAFVQAQRRGAMTEAKKNADRQFAVNFAPLGVTLARRGKPVASRDIRLDNSAIGRQLDAALDRIGSSKVSVGLQRMFATGGDPEKSSRVVDSMTQAVRQQADMVKNQRLAKVLARQGSAFSKIVKENKLDRDNAARSVGAYLLSRDDAAQRGVTHAAAYANYVTNAKDLGKVKNEYLPFDSIEKLFKGQITFADSVAKSTAKAEVRSGVKTQADIRQNYVPRIARKGADNKRVDEIEGWQGPTTALRSSTTQKARVLKTSEDWWKNGLVPEDDYFRLAQWRMFQSVDLLAQQQALNAVSSRFGRVMDENEIIGKVLGRQGKALEKFQKASNLVAKAEQAQGRADTDVVQRNLQIAEARTAREAAEQVRAGQINQAEGRVDLARGVAAENPLPTQAQAAREAAQGAQLSFADLQAVANEKFTARQMLQMARNEYARRAAEVDAGLDKAAVLRPYADFISRAEAAVKEASRKPGKMVNAEASALKTQALALLSGEKSARRADLNAAKAELRAARRTANKVAIERAKGRVREAQLRAQAANERAARSRTSTEAARKRADQRARILDDRTQEVVAAQDVAERTLKTPGARASAEEMARYKEMGWQQLQYDYDSVVSLVSPEVRAGVDRAFQKAWEVTSNQGTYSEVRRFVNGATSRWKGLSLISVGYHMRNLQSDLMMAWIAGAKDPRSIVQAIQIMRGRTGSVVVGGKRMSYADLLREATSNGTVRAGEISADAGRIAQQAERQGRGIVGKPRMVGEGSVAQGSYRFGRFREDSTRMMLYIEMRKGGQSADEAAETVRNYLFDYGDVSRFVSSTRRFLLPFITWSAKALPRIVKQSVEKPRTITRIGFATDAANESFGPIDTSVLPLGRTLSFAIPTMGLGSGTYTYNPENTLPYGVVNSFNPFGFKNAGRSVGTFLNPLVKTPIELATNYNLYQGRTAPRRVQAPVWIRALSGAGVTPSFLDVGDKQDLYTKETVTGYSRAWDSIFRMFPPYQLAQAYPGVGVESDRIGYLRSLFGVNVSPYERQRDLFYAQRFAPKA